MRRLLALCAASAALLALPALVEATLPAPAGPGRHVLAQLTDMEARFDGGCPHAVAPLVDSGVGDVLADSHVATGLMSLATRSPELRSRAAALAGRVVDCIAAASPVDLEAPETWGDENLYLSHLALAVGIEAALGGGRDPRQDALAKHLRARSLADGDGHARSAPGCCKWPADQAATLSALTVHDHVRGTHLADEPVRAWLARVGTTGLHVSAISPSLWYADLPRGCALSWTAFHMAQFAPVEGRALWDRYVVASWVDVAGLGGLREWPDGVDAAWDVDSGPVIFGMGTGATGLGLAPARVYGDARVLAAIERTSLVFGAPWGWRSREMLAVPFLADAILFHGAAATTWFSTVAPVGGDPGAPWLPGALLAGDLAVLGLAAWVAARRD